ncbi:MAG: hypothetical protein M0R03_20590, partial [Novosphingobium sp.]|nr:hypothetical protein [Novosphingobium sp.]
QTRLLFIYNYECFRCGKNKWDILHHIMGGNFEEADSPLNAACLCNYPCHIGWSFDDKISSRFLYKTLKYLYLNKYKLNSNDIKFIQEFYKIYLLTPKSKELIDKMIKTAHLR